MIKLDFNFEMKNDIRILIIQWKSQYFTLDKSYINQDDF